MIWQAMYLFQVQLSIIYLVHIWDFLLVFNLFSTHLFSPPPHPSTQPDTPLMGFPGYWGRPNVPRYPTTRRTSSKMPQPVCQYRENWGHSRQKLLKPGYTMPMHVSRPATCICQWVRCWHASAFKVFCFPWRRHLA